MKRGEFLTKNGITGEKANKIAECIGIRGYNRYAGMTLKCVRKWATEPLKIRGVARQHPGNWGPWYHVSMQFLNPITKKWIFSKAGEGVNN